MQMAFLLLLIVSSTTAYAQPNVAVVKLLRGTVEAFSQGKTGKLKVGDWLENGAIIRTADKSFAKLIFIDKSQMNVGPNSEMKIESFTGKDSGVIELVKGKIRSQVTKDYLQIQERDKSKLFIKTKNAVMGVRGTDFLISTNGRSTSTVLFEGEVVFNRLSEREMNSTNLEEIVNRGVQIFPGEFSVVDVERPVPTVPALLNIQQREHLEKNQEFDKPRTPASGGPETAKSVVPHGLTGHVVANNPEIIKHQVSEISKIDGRESPSREAEGFVKGEMIKPPNGSFLDVESGVIVPPGPTSVLDSNSNTYIPGPESGKIQADGTYVPPKNIQVNPNGTAVVSVPPGGPAPAIAPPPPPAQNDILGTTSSPSTIINQHPPTGGIQGVTDPTRIDTTSKVPTTIIVKPQ